MNSVFTTLQSYLGTNYVNDFNFLGRTFQVNLRGDPDFQADPSQIQRMYTRNNAGGMVPLGSLLDVQEVYSARRALESGSKGPPLLPGVSNIGLAPVGDGANYGREFFTFLGQRVGEAWGVPLVKARPN